MSDQEPQPPPAGADRTGDSFFARRAWVIAVAVGVTVLGTVLAGVPGLLVGAVVAAVFLLVAAR